MHLFHCTLKFYRPVYWPVWLMIGVLWLVIQLPYVLQMQLGKFLGWMWLLPNTRLKRTARINIALCFPELNGQEQKELLRRNFMNMGMAVFESGLAWFGSEKKLRRLAHFYGLEHIQTAKMSSKGVLLLGLHFLTLELGGRLFALNQDFTIVYRAQKKPFLNFLVSSVFRRCYAHVIERHNVRTLLKALKSGQIVWYTPDIDAGFTDHLFIPFFNIPAATFTGTVRLLEASHAKVVPCAYYRRDDGSGYDIHFFEALEDFPSGHMEQDLRRINQVAEELIREHPEQYMWQYKRFKTRFQGEKDLYL
jgi:KDO2-lipid IV(A) lauroyltransferase